MSWLGPCRFDCGSGNRVTCIERDWSAAFTPLPRTMPKRAGHFTGLVLLGVEAGGSPRAVTARALIKISLALQHRILVSAAHHLFPE
jgi:hypothetical protein